MFSKFLKILKFKIWALFKIDRFNSFYLSHSQFGEDMLLRSLFGNKKTGIYIDIGAHHPIFYSNTYHFYRKGWRGINIDAQPGAMEIFDLLRPRDKNIEACISSKSGEKVSFYQFEKGALNTIDENIANKLVEEGNKLIKKHSLTTLNVMDCLSKFHQDLKKIDYLNIDIEGLDQIVLQSIDFKLLRPMIISFEDHAFDIENPKLSESFCFLMDKEYKFAGKAGSTIIMKNYRN